MTKRKAATAFAAQSYSCPPSQPHYTNASPPMVQPSKSVTSHPRHPPVTPDQLALCGAGLCNDCFYAKDLKLKFEALFGPALLAPTRPAPAALATDDDDDNEPTIRQDNMSYERIVELEDENVSLKEAIFALKKKVAKLRKKRKSTLMRELEEEDEAGDAEVEDSGISLLDLSKASSENRDSSDERLPTVQSNHRIKSKPPAASKTPPRNEKKPRPLHSKGWTSVNIKTEGPGSVARLGKSESHIALKDETSLKIEKIESDADSD